MKTTITIAYWVLSVLLVYVQETTSAFVTKMTYGYLIK